MASGIDPQLLRALARRAEVYEPGEGPWTAEELAYDEWVRNGEPLDGLSAEDAQLLAERPLTVRQVALRERVSEKTVYRWLASGELAATRAGTKWQITRDALEQRRIEAAKPKAKAPAPQRRRRRKKAASGDAGGWFKP